MRGYRLPEGMLLGVKNEEHRNNWKEDTDLMAVMGIETERFTIPWSGIQPQKGIIDYGAVNHFREEITYMKTRGIRPLLTIIDAKVPDWFEKRGGFLQPHNVKYFLRYVGILVNYFGDLVSDYVTFDDPYGYAMTCYGGAGFRKGKKSYFKVRRMLSVMAGCHIRAYAKIHRMRTAMGYHDTKVGMALEMRAFAAVNPLSSAQSYASQLSQYLSQDMVAEAFLRGNFHRLLTNMARFEKGVYCDYLGINYYTRSLVAKLGDDRTRPQDPKNDCGWTIYPEGLEDVMQELTAICPKPIWILENGICDNKDSFRSLYLFDQLAVLSRTELPVERYYYRDFLDAEEGDAFGLVSVNAVTDARTVKKSGHFYRELITSKGVTAEMTERYLAEERYHP